MLHLVALMSAVYLGSVAVISAMFWPRHRSAGATVLEIVVPSLLIAVAPTVLIWALFFR
jgi:hypothetical protein